MEMLPRDPGSCGHPECRPSEVCRRLMPRLVDLTPLQEIQSEQIRTITQTNLSSTRSEQIGYIRGLQPMPGADFSRQGVLVNGEANTPVWECDRCGALVAESSRTKHRNWHS